MEVEVEGGVEELDVALGGMDVLEEGIFFGAPVFADDEEVVLFFEDVADPFVHELWADVFNGVEAEAIDVGGIEVPFAPVFEFVSDGGVAGFDVGEHEEVVVAEFFFDEVFPSVAVFILDGVDGFFFFIFCPVNAAEAVPVPDEV